MADDVSNFEVPLNLRLPEELQGSTPRSIPNSFWESEPVKSRRSQLIGYLIAGTVCVVIPFLPFLKTVAQYVFPLAFLPYLGLFIWTHGLGLFLRESRVKRNLNYIRSGECSFARVRELVKSPTTEESSMFITIAIAAHVEMIHPVSQDAFRIALRTSDFSLDNKDKVKTKLRVGDWVPVVWMASDFENTLQVYEFIEATPESGLLRDTPSLAWTIPLTILTFVAAFTCLCVYSFATGRYLPVDFGIEELKTPFVIGVLLGLLATAAIGYGFFFEKREIDKQNREAEETGSPIEYSDYHSDAPLAVRRFSFNWNFVPGLLPIVTLTCFVTTVGTVVVWVCISLTANALLDDSKATRVPIVITGRSNINSVIFYPEFTLKYKIVGRKNTKDFLTLPQHQNQFIGPNGMAVLREGYFGWQWVESLELQPQVDD